MGTGTFATPVGAAMELGDSHIVLEAPEELLEGAPQAELVSARFDLKSPFRGTRTEVTLYEEGFLAVCVEYRGKRRSSITLNLRYLDPRPTISRALSMKMLYSCALTAALAGVSMTLAGAGLVSGTVCLPAAFLFGAAAGTFGWLFLSQSGERCVFRTRNGRAEALALFATFGSIRMLRRIAPAVVAAIREAGTSNADRNASLRAEMREHYRLAQTGVITEEECGTSTQRILRHFA
jgi:hypothetical protein